MKKIGVAGLQREQIKNTIEATAPGCFEVFIHNDGNDSNLLIVFYVQIMPDDFVMQLHRF